MERNDVPALANSGICHDVYAFLSQLRIKEYEVELSKIGKKIPEYQSILKKKLMM